MAAASTLWGLPVSITMHTMEDGTDGSSAFTQILSPKKRADPSSQTYAQNGSFTSNSPASIGERTLMHLMNLLEQRHGSNRDSMASAADSGTRAPSMAETIQMNEFAAELMILECLGIILHPSNIEDFEGPWPAFPDSVICSQKAIAATLKKVALVHELRKAKLLDSVSDSDANDRELFDQRSPEHELVLLPELKSMLEKVDLFELSRNKKSSKALHRYVQSARWNIDNLEMRSRSQSESQEQAHNSTRNSALKSSGKLSLVFRILHKFVSEISLFLDDLNDHGGSLISGAADGSISGGAPTLNTLFQPGRAREGDVKLFDHIFLCRDKMDHPTNSIPNNAKLLQAISSKRRHQTGTAWRVNFFLRLLEVKNRID